MEVGPHGSLQSIADMMKLLGKQILTPVATDRFVYVLAPLLVFLPTLCVASLIPLAGAELASRRTILRTISAMLTPRRRASSAKNRTWSWGRDI
jgi:NADH:ubiquinone oxidoreductase subunit H